MDLIKLIQEGRIDDFRNKYSKKFGEDKVKNIISSVPQKYLDWAGKNLDVINFDETFGKTVSALNSFEKISSNLPITDLYQYKSLGQLFSALTEYGQKIRRQVKPVNGGNVVYDDGRYFVVNPLNHDSSCYYGKGTKWCTTAETDTYFNKYNEDGKLFYIIDRALQTNDPKYKVALLQKFDGEKIFHDVLNDRIFSGWLFNTNKLEEIQTSINDYLNKQFPEQIKIFLDKESAKREKDRLNRLRLDRILQDKRRAAQERRLSNEWELGPDCPEVGLKAHALLDVLVSNSEVEVMTNEDRGEIARIENEIQRLQTEYDNDNTREDLSDEIRNLEDELNELQNKIDVYNIIPIGKHYDTMEFEVIDSEVEGNRYAVGDEDEMRSSAYDSIDSLIDDIGYEGFSKNFVMDYIDEADVLNTAEEYFEEFIRESPESYIDEDERLLSDEQEDNIGRLRVKISQAEVMIERLQSDMDGENDEQIQDRIDEMNELIEEYTTEISDIEESPEGDFPESEIEYAVKQRVHDVKRDLVGFIDEFGLEWTNYINREELIQGVIDADGYAHTLNSYDGSADETYVMDELYYVMRIN
jgi:hypothetical protein